MTETETAVTPRLRRDQFHFFFDPNEAPAIRVESGTRLIVETEDAHRGSIRTENDVYPTIASVFEREFPARLCCQIWAPVVASSARTVPSGTIVYMTPR